MYAKVENGVITQFPVMVTDVIRAHPNTSFPAAGVPPSFLQDLGYVEVTKQSVAIADYQHQTGWQATLNEDGTVTATPVVTTLPLDQQRDRIKAKAREKAGNLIGQEEQVSMLWEGLGIVFGLLKENFSGKTYVQAKSTLSIREQQSLDDMVALQPARKLIYDHAATLITAAQAGQHWTLADGTWPGDI